MICYASVTGTKRNLAAMREGGFRLVVTAGSGHRPVPGFRHGLDNGAFRAWLRGDPFDEAVFVRTVADYGAAADWIVVPDIVAGGGESLALSRAWLPDLRAVGPLLLIAVQDGMEPADLADLCEPGAVGVFLGGTTEWKLATMRAWGVWCAARGIYLHVGRVNTEKRMALAAYAGADSTDGTCASRFSIRTAALARAAALPDLFRPPKDVITNRNPPAVRSPTWTT